jgi:hypothetical protein
VTKTEGTTAAAASIEDVLGSIGWANELVREFLVRLLRQERSLAAAMGYVLALGRDVRANCWDLAERAGHENPYRFQKLPGSYRWSWEDGRERLPALAQQVLGGEPDDEAGRAWPSTRPRT